VKAATDHAWRYINNALARVCIEAFETLSRFFMEIPIMAGVSQWRRPMNQSEIAQDTNAWKDVATLAAVAAHIVVVTVVMVGMLALMTVVAKL
jgi:hypothetical protein